MKKYIFKEGNQIIFGMDFAIWKGLPSDRAFQIREDKKGIFKNAHPDSVEMIARGYGFSVDYRYGFSEDYGNGSIFLEKKYLEEAFEYEDYGIDLKSCPCCDSIAIFKCVEEECDNFNGIYIECINLRCGLTTPLKFSIKEDCKPLLAEISNRRVK